MKHDPSKKKVVRPLTGEANKKMQIVICIFLMVATCAAYWQVVDHEFLNYDDNEFIISDVEVGPDEDIVSRNLEQNIQSALNELPSDFKTVIILRDIQELSYEDISRIISVPLGTIKSRINRGRLKLQQLLRSKGEKRY